MSGILLWIGVGAIGGVGAILRFLIDAVVSARSQSGLPLGTLVVNISAGALIGFLAGVVFTGNSLLLTATGLLGSYSTFSTWMLESHRLSEDGQVTSAWVNLGLSLGAGIGAVALGRLLGSWL